MLRQIRTLLRNNGKVKNFRSLSCKEYANNTGITSVTIIGGGLMGTGITQCLLEKSITTHIIDADKASLEKAIIKLEKGLLLRGAKKYKDDKSQINAYLSDKMSHVSTSVKLSESNLETTDLVIEATVETLPLKQDIFRRIEKITKQDVIYTTNTSSLLVEEIFKEMSPERQKNVSGLHFFNPVPLMKLVEVVPVFYTHPTTIDKLYTFTEFLGKTPVTSKDKPGFIANRLLIPFLLDAARMLEREDATKEDIDKAMQLGAGHPMGPLRLMDLIGLDTVKHIIDGWHKKYPNEHQFRPCGIIDKLVKERKYGRKSKSGFYNYHQN